MSRRIVRISVMLFVVAALTGCSPVKHVPSGNYLLDKVSVHVDHTPDGSKAEVTSKDLTPYLRQTANHRVLGGLRLQLGVYSLSERDSTRWWNRWLRSMGEAPVIYDSTLADASARQLRLAMLNRGYPDATVSVEKLPNAKKKRMKLVYNVNPGAGMRIGSVEFDIPDSTIRSIVMADSSRLSPRPGELLDRNKLDQIRAMTAAHLRDKGYYAFTKEQVSFIADTTAGSRVADLTINVGTLATPNSTLASEVWKIGKVIFVTDYRPGATIAQIHREARDSVTYKGLEFLMSDDHYIKPSTLEGKCFLRPGQNYSDALVTRTYESLTQLGILRTVNINTVEVSPGVLDIYILLSRRRKQSMTFELEGTHSEGDLGVGGSITYQHRDLGKRSELFTAKVRANYESISGNLEGFINDRYTEYAGEMGITFPRFLFPFLTGNYKRRIRAVSEVAVSFNYQERPEYTRIIAGAGWKYKWNNRFNTSRRTLDLLDMQYVYLPKTTVDFINAVAPENPLLRYSYEDHFIMRLGYTLYHTNRRVASAFGTPVQQAGVYTLRASVETAGNLLYGISHIIGQHRTGGVYKILGVPYSQYAKAEIDYTFTRRFNPRHSIAFHAGAGIAVPYGNSQAVPFEKRFYAGGANGVRGWAVRTLGPGSYNSRNSVTGFINQCGDVSLLMSAEYRAKLFWVIEGALFVDGGNIWTIKNYENQPGGLFRFDRFWKEIAWSYGIGLRLDFTYFLFRLDLGFKAYNPAADQQRWPLTHPNWHRDATFHFSVGYPF